MKVFHRWNIYHAVILNAYSWISTLSIFFILELHIMISAFWEIRNLSHTILLLNMKHHIPTLTERLM